MRFFQRVIEDMKRGDNIELVVTIIVAMVLAVLNLLGLAQQTWIGSVTIAVLALLAAALLGNRQRLDDIQRKLGQADSGEILKDFPEELTYDLQKASEIWLFGVHVIAALRYHHQILERKLEKGISIRVLVVDPNGVAVNMTAARVPGKASPQREQTNILANLIDVCELKAISPDNLHIRVVDEPLFYGGYMLNPEGSDGVVYLRRYTYQTGFTPKLIYHKGVHQEWFDLYKSELRSLWNRGVEWTCSD